MRHLPLTTGKHTCRWLWCRQNNRFRFLKAQSLLGFHNKDVRQFRPAFRGPGNPRSRTTESNVSTYIQVGCLQLRYVHATGV